MKKSFGSVGSATSPHTHQLRGELQNVPLPNGCATHCPVQPTAATEITGSEAPGKPMPFVPELPAAATLMTPCATARPIAACSQASGVGPPRLLLITARHDPVVP